ncbi:hypothetical protein KY332_00100 [Candidatus Woesearchaeota archaeon]|nr:hypothetical protein [Candidatus Woesearchaeota archaeon]
MIITLLLIAGCKKAEEVTPPELPEITEAQEEEAELGEEGKMLTLLQCTNGAIEAVITNTGTEEATLAKDIKVIINGLLVVDPECDSMTIAAGESTYCKDISGHIATRIGKVNTIVANAKNDRSVEYIDCAAE